ncbi:MAG: protein kinase, partial [Pyrinomonadaceae bacterium]|nr:protein kinase [Pyrinomonadaceae bacterium]
MSTENWLQLKTLFHAALDLTPAERASFVENACKDNEGLRSQLEKLLASHDETGAFLISPAVLVATNSDNPQFNGNESVDLAGQRIGPYEIIREIGHGGMGTVYLAVRADDQYRKQVAIKLINRGMDTDLILRRFMMERQILANLEHPNIAHLLEGGSTAEGLPYFVMEYVDGEAITSYCDAREFNISQRLELFREVCAALQYAHQNLVVHRDIKPSNILVTEEGVPKLLDFGIAKLLTPDWAADTSEATASMVRLMTPRYASPEQLRGLSITTTSDVYSLGLVLYELLSGHHPYRASSGHPEEIAEMILRQEPEKPSTAASRPRADDANETAVQHSATDNAARAKANPQSEIRNPKFLRGDLDNIVLKALRKEPDRRYASVHEFSEDIRRHLEGLPVTASPDTFGYRAAKFISRNKVGAVAAAVVVATLLTATVITAWQARVARRERVRAEQRFNDVRKLANSVVFGLHDSIQNLPGSTPARELLVTSALEYLDKLAAEAGQDPSLQLELAAAYDKIGDIQGGKNTNHLGQRQKAKESYGKALKIREELLSAEPANVSVRRQLSGSYTKQGDMRFLEVDLDGSLEAYRQALALNQRLAEELPDDFEIRFELAMGYSNVGHLLAVSKGDDKGSLENLQKAEVLLEELVSHDANNTKFQQELSDVYDRKADVLSVLNPNYAEALVFNRKSLEISEMLVKVEPFNTRFRRGVAVSHYRIGELSEKMGDLKTALDSSRKALAIFTELSTKDPKNDEFRQVVATFQAVVSEILIKTGRAAESIELLKKSLLTLQESFAHSPTDEVAHLRIGVVQAGLGKGYVALASNEKSSATKSLADWRAARSWFQKSQEIHKIFFDAGDLVGDDAARYELVNNGIKTCDAAIARL